MNIKTMVSVLGSMCASAMPSPAMALRSITQRKAAVILQFDDGNITHYTNAWPVLQAHGFRGSFGIVTANVGNSWSMSGAMLRELDQAGCSFQDHTRDHNAAKWGSASFADQWGPDILFSQAVFADSVGISPMTAWNQPGGPGEGWTTELGNTLAAHGYRYTAGAVALTNSQWLNFHYGFIDNPFRLGRYIYSWGYNAPAAGWTWQAEVENIKFKMAEAVAQGFLPQLVFHVVGPDEASGLAALCDWMETNGIDAMTMDQAFDEVREGHDSDYGRNIAALLTVDRDGNGRPDGWGNIYAPVAMGGSAVNGAGTIVTGPPVGKLACTWTISEPLLTQYFDDVTFTYEKTLIDPMTFTHTTVTESRTHTILPFQTATFADTLEILDSEHVDRVKASVSMVWMTPFILHEFTAVPVVVPTAVRDRSPRADLAVRAWPNPSSGDVHIAFSMEDPGPVSIAIYSVGGTLVDQLVDREVSDGLVERVWRNRRAPSGVYFARVTVGGITTSKKIMLIR